MQDPADAGCVAADRFYGGTIARVYPGTRTGMVRTRSGREIAFAVPDVQIVGTIRGFAALHEGMSVGFDLGRTSRGLRVTVIRVRGDVEQEPGEPQSGSEVR